VRSTHDLSGSQSVITPVGRPGLAARLGEAEPVCTACAQQATGSPFLTKSQRGSRGGDRSRPHERGHRYDEVVLPYRSGYLSGPSTQITNITLQARCPLDFTDHLLIIYDYAALQWVGTHCSAMARPAQPSGHSAYETRTTPRTTPALSAAHLKREVECVRQSWFVALPYARSSGGLA